MADGGQRVEQTLGYAPRPARGRAARRRVGIALLTVAVVVIGWGYWRPVRDYLVCAYWERQALAEVPPDGETVYETEPGRVATLLAGGAYVAVPRPFVAAQDGDEASEDRQVAGTQSAQFRARCLGEYVRAATASSGPKTLWPLMSGTTVACSRLVSVGGHPRIVIVTAREFVAYGNDEPTRGMVYEASVIKPGSPRKKAALLHRAQSYDGGFMLDEHPRVLRGRVDPTDRSRLSVDVVSAERAGARRAWWTLNDDDTLTSGVETMEDAGR